MALDPAVRLTLMDALSQAASEITNELEGTSVEVRLKGREPIFVVVGAGAEAMPPAPPRPSRRGTRTRRFDARTRRSPGSRCGSPSRSRRGPRSWPPAAVSRLNTWLVNAARAAAAINININIDGPDGPRRPRPKPFIQQAHPGVGAMTSEGTMHTFDTPGPVNLRVEL